MGTWGTGSLDNDTAVDWTYGLEDVDDLSYVEKALDVVLAIGATSEVSVDLGECAIAAAEVLVRLIQPQRDDNPYAEAVETWVRAHPIVPSAEVVAKAILDEARELAGAQGVAKPDAAVVEGNPAIKILDYADDNDVDTIVIGSSGLGRIEGLLLGSVSQKVNYLSKCTCITVK